MQVKYEQTDFDAILNPDFYERCTACNQILKANGIALQITDIRQVFSLIAPWDGPFIDDVRRQCLQGQVELLRFIQEYGRPLNYAMLTPEMITEHFLDACHRNSTKPDLSLIKELVEHGADIHAHDSRGFTAFQLATSIYDREIMALFLEHGSDINEEIRYLENKTSTVWLEKVKYADLNDLQLMLEHGARANDRDSDGSTPLMKYCEGKPVCEGVALLLKHGADATCVDSDGNSALHLIAGGSADAETVSQLIDAGANVNLFNRFGDVPLHINSRYQLAGNEKTAIALLERGANPNLRDSSGDTPLILAARCDKPLVVIALMEHGADTDIRSASGKRACEIALDKGFVQTASYIDPNAFVEYENLMQSSGIPHVKTQIIERLKAGQKHYQSDKEGYSEFLSQGDVFLHERYENGAHPPIIHSYATDESALAYLYASNRSYSSDETEISIYQSILNSLK